MAERPLYTLYKNLKAQNYDVPDDYNKFESALTRDGKGGADNRHAIYENLKSQNFDVPNTYERFYSALFEPRSKTSSRAKGGSVPMSAADRARFSAGAAAISASAQYTMNNAGRYNRLKQRKQKQQKDFGRVNLGTHQTPYGGDANNVVKDDFAYNPETGKAGAYVSSDNKNVYSQPEAEQEQAVLDQQNNAYQEAVDTGEIPSVFDVRDKNGNYDLQENINKNGTHLTEEGAQKQFDKKLADAYARKKEIEALIAEDHRQHGNPLLSYGASIGASNGRTAEQSDYSNKLATSLALVKQQIGALEAVKQYPTSSWGEDALKALDNTAFTAKTWDFGLTDFATMGQMERIKTKMDNNLPLSGSDKMLLKSKLGADAAAALEDEKMGNIYRWTKIAGQSLPFMADFFLTGGYGGVTKAISRGALKFAAKRGMGKVSAAILKNTGIVAGDVIGSYAMAGSEQAMKTGADIMQRHLGSLYQDEKGDYKFGTFDENGNLLHEGGESMGTALYKGLTSAMVENYTEKLFGHSYGIKKGAINFMEKHGMNASAEFFKNIGKSGWYTNSKKWMEKFGINGFGEEVMEEEIGIPLHALLDGDNKFSDLLDTKQQLDIIGGMALSVGSMYAMGAGSRPVKGLYNRAQYYRFRNKVNVADSDAQNLMGDKWADIKDKIDNSTNEQMGGVLADILRQRDTMSKDQINAAINYGINLMKMRGYNVAKTAEMNAREITNEPTTPEEQHQEDIDNAYSEGHDADDADKHDIQLEHEDQMKTLAGLLNISEQQLSAMNDDELQSLTGQNDKLDQAIYDYQLSSARYQGVTDDAQDKIDMAANQAAQRVDMYTDKSRGSVRNATVKASGGAEDYGVYIISGNIATNEDGSINVADSDDMILFYDPTTNSVEHADALRFADLGDEVPADDVKAQAVADAKEKAIKEVAGIVDGTIDVGSQFNVTGADGLEHTYEILADYGDGTAAISIDGNVVENPYSLEDLQQLKDLEDQKRLEAAKTQREQMEKERAEQQTQETELPEETQPSLDFNQILNDNGNVVLVDVLDKDGNTKYPDSKLFLIRDSGAKAKVVEMKSDGTFVPHAVSKKNVATISSMSLDEYKQAMAETSMIEENSGENRGEIEVEAPTIEGETAAPAEETAAPESAETPATEQTPAAPAITLEDGTIVPMLEDGNHDFSKLTADQTAELYDSQFGEDADSVISGWVSDAKKALDKANNMTVKGKNFVEQKAAKEAKEKAIADAQTAYDSAVAIRDAYNERQLAKVEDTAEGRKELIEKARRKFSRLKSAVKDDSEAVSQLYKDVVGSLLHRLYDGTGIDVTDTIPLTAEEYVASNLGAHSLNYEGTETSKGVKQETGLSREDFAKTQLLAADGKGTTIDDLVHSLWENRPSNLESLDTQDIRNALIGVLNSGFRASEARNYIENLRIAQAENILEEQKKAADNAAFAEENKAESEQQTETAPESEEKTGEDNSDEMNDEENENINEQTNAPELSHEQQKAMEEGEKLGFPAFDKEGEPINEYVVELAKWAKKQGLEIDPTSKLNSYADLFLMCKDDFGVSTLVPDEGENINQVVYFPDNVKDFDQLWKLQEEFNAGRDLKHSSNIDSEITEGATFYDADTAREFKEFVDKKVEEQNKVFGEQRPEEDLPFSAMDNGTQQTTSERAADVEKNKVDDMKVVDNIVGEKTRKAFERLAKMMGAKIQWQYSDKLGNGWIQETKDADGNVHRTIFITLDSSVTEGAQFIFGHEMTHQIKNLNPAAYNELTQLVLDTYGSDAFDKAVDETMQRYFDAGFSGRARDYYAEEVVADAIGEMIRDLNLAHTLAMKMSHPLLAAIHEILQKIKLAFFGTEYSDVTKNIIRSIEQAYVKTANGKVTNSETGEDVSYSLRQKPEPKKKGIGYKVFVLKDGKLYPPMVANPDGAATPVGVWLDADAAPIAGESKTGRPQVKQGGKGTQGGSGKLAYRPGWHLGVVPYAIQFNRKDADGNKTLFPKNFVFAEVEYAADVDYQEEARQEGINPSGKYQHSLAGLKHLPTDGYYMYRTNPNPETDPWVITGAMKVNRILTRAEQADLVSKAGREPQQIQDGDIVTDDVVNSINQEIADAPKFSLKVYHGSGAKFDKFDFSHMGEGEGSQAFGWGGYVTNSKDIAEDYTRRAKIRKDNGGFDFVTDMSANNKDMVRQYIYKHKDVNKGLDAMRKDLSSALEMFPDDDDLKELSNILAKKNEEIAVPDNIAYLYDVDIPDDNGDYLDWDAPLTDKQKNTIIKELRRLKIDFADFKKRGFSFDGSFGGNAYDFLMYALRKTKKWKDVNASRAVSKFLSSIGFTGIKYKAGTIFGGAKEGDYNYVIFDENNANIVGNTRFSLRYDQFEHDLNQWKKDNNLPKDAQRPTIPQRYAGESAVDFLRRVDEYRKMMALWKTAPTYEQHLLSDDTALGEFNRELQRGSVLKRIAFQDSMLAIRKAQEAIMKEVGVDRLNMAEDAYTAENRSHGKGKNEFEEYNNEFLQPLRKAYHQMKKILGDSYDNVRIYMMAKHGLERDAQMAFKKSLEADYEDVAQRSAAYKAYKGDMNRIINDSDLEFGRVDFNTWRQRDNALRAKYSPSYMNYRYDKNGIAYDYSGLSALFDGSDFEEAAYKLVRDIESSHVTEVQDLWNATNAATKKILRDGYKAGMMSKDTYQYVRDMYSHYIPLRGWDGTTADQVWDYIGGGKGAFNQTLKTAHGRTSIADDPIAYIENMAESGILLNNKNWVKQHLMLLAQNHPTSLLTLSKAWYVKSTDANGNEEWIPATPQITSQMNSNQVKAAIDAFEKKMEQMTQTGDATQKRDGLNIAYPQTHSEEREHEVRVMKDGEEYVIYVNGDPQLAQAMNNTRAHRVREIQSGKLDRAAAWLGRKMAAAYTSLSPLFIPSNYFRDLTMTLASTAIREDGRYNYLLRKNLATSWNLGFMLRDYQSGKLRDKVSSGNATPKEQMFYDFMMNGGETGFVSSLDVEDLKKKFKNDLKDLDRWKANPVKVGHTIMDGIEFLNRMIEDSNRFAVYMTSIQYGRSIDEAVNDAKDVTLNFNRKGTGEYGWQMIRNLYLFINPAVQSLQTLGALTKHHPFKFTAVTAAWLASGVLVPIVNAALMRLFGGDDDKDKYWQFTKWDRRNNLIMWIPLTNEYVKIPLAQEFRAFYGVGDMIASKMMGGELAKETWSQYAEDLLGQVVDMLPLDPTGYDGNIAVSLMPNPIRPVFELAFNVDFTGKPLFKETEYNKYDPNFTKAYVGTPDWLVRVSKMVNSIGNDYPDVQQNAIDAFGDPRYNLNNPAVVDHVLSSYLGGAYTMGSQVLGFLTKSLNDPKEIKMADIPLVSKFVSNPDDRPVTKKQGDEFWNMKENHDRAANTLSKLKKQAKVDGDYSMLERFYGSEEYKQYKQDDVKVKKYEEDKKKERSEESGEEYRPHKLNAEDIYKAHATPQDDFEDLKLKQLFTKLNGFKTSYDLLVDTAPGQSDGYYNTNKVAIDAIDEISLDKQEISELKKGFLDDGKDAYNAEDMKQIRDLRKKILAVLEKANKVVVANQKAKAEK